MVSCGRSGLSRRWQAGNSLLLTFPNAHTREAAEGRDKQERQQERACCGLTAIRGFLQGGKRDFRNGRCVCRRRLILVLGAQNTKITSPPRAKITKIYRKIWPAMRLFSAPFATRPWAHPFLVFWDCGLLVLVCGVVSKT